MSGIGKGWTEVCDDSLDIILIYLYGTSSLRVSLRDVCGDSARPSLTACSAITPRRWWSQSALLALISSASCLATHLDHSPSSLLAAVLPSLKRNSNRVRARSRR